MTNTILKSITLALAATTTAATAGDMNTYSVEGETYESYVAFADNPRGTIMILPTWNGLSDFEMDRAQMLADMGFNAFAADLYPTGQRPTTMEAKQAGLASLLGDQERMHAILQSAIAAARQGGDEPLLVMGYSMGALTAMELAWSGLGNDLGVDGYIIFSGRVSDPRGRMMPEDVAPFFLAIGESDQRIPLSSLPSFIDDVEMAGGSVTAHTLPNAGHLFSAFGFPNYNAEADADSWETLTEFLEEAVGT